MLPTRVIVALILFVTLSMLSISVVFLFPDYKIAGILIAIVSLFALVMVGFTAYNMVYEEAEDTKTIQLQTCPDYFTRTTNDKGKAICKKQIKTDNEVYIAGKTKNKFDDDILYKNNISAEAAGSAITKDIKHINDTSNIINLDVLNKLGKNISDNKKYNQAICACGQNLGWHDLTQECSKPGREYIRNDNIDPCIELNKMIDEMKADTDTDAAYPDVLSKQQQLLGFRNTTDGTKDNKYNFVTDNTIVEPDYTK